MLKMTSYNVADESWGLKQLGERERRGRSEQGLNQRDGEFLSGLFRVFACSELNIVKN